MEKFLEKILVVMGPRSMLLEEIESIRSSSDDTIAVPVKGYINLIKETLSYCVRHSTLFCR